ncbi:hypothetical protein CAEBREN_21105 [Caenorhabditis brenneri]|uniref:DUF19 domain-containing protein n=1 Tax=Caenorhabditis brenneri TaxID=135651 RepID=G0NNP6_CAEBE|nr:hypothetical protein CAEBREN_21105 [Caenorhabditis brenneri]
MLKILLMLFVLGCARAHPFLNQCSEEQERVSDCAKAVQAKYGPVFMEDYQVNNEAIMEFTQCIGEVACKATHLRIQILHQKIILNQKFRAIPKCLTEFNYRRAQDACRDILTPGCQKEEIVDCISKALLQNEDCSDADATYFKTLVPEFEKRCH